MLTLLLAQSKKLPLLQQKQFHQQLTSSLQSVCMLLLLTLPSSTLLFVEVADDGKTSHFQHNYLRSFCYMAY
jgi:hypothetical protein